MKRAPGGPSEASRLGTSFSGAYKWLLANKNVIFKLRYECYQALPPVDVPEK